MRRLCDHRRRRILATSAIGALLLLPGARPLHARHKRSSKASSNDPTSRLYQILDDSYDGKLKGLCLLADIYTDPSDPSKQYQRVLRVDYDKSRFFGRFTIDIRSVAKLTPKQLQSYSPPQVFDFAETDTEKFEKINPGPFGGSGDLYLQAPRNGPLQPAPVTDRVRQEYDNLVTNYILPAVQKKP
jgi:hypothetical protein